MRQGVDDREPAGGDPAVTFPPRPPAPLLLIMERGR